jgi:DNA-binding protein Fis
MLQNTSASPSEPSETGSTIGISKELASKECRPNQLYNATCELFLDGKNLNDKFIEMEQAILFVALDRCKWNKTEAATLCGLNRTTLVEKCRRHGLMTDPRMLDG